MATLRSIESIRANVKSFSRDDFNKEKNNQKSKKSKSNENSLLNSFNNLSTNLQ